MGHHDTGAAGEILLQRRHQLLLLRTVHPLLHNPSAQLARTAIIHAAYAAAHNRAGSAT